MPGLEELSLEERQKFNLGALVATMLSDPVLGKQTKRLLKTKSPDLSFPELDAEDAILKGQEKSQAQIDELKTLLRTREARDALASEDAKITAVGLDPKVVRKFMTDEGINNVDIVIELFESRQALAEPTTSSVGPFRFEGVTQDDLKNMWKDPVKWREEKAYEVINELRGKKRA
jgi:hypothetical protein